MLRITLERRPSHDDLAAFGFAVSVMTGLAVGLLAAVAGAGWLGAGVLTLMTVLIVTGWGTLQPTVFTMPYRKWNGLARRFANVAQRFTMAVTFHLVFTTVALVGARFTKSGRGVSGWSHKEAPRLRTQLGYVPPAGEPAEWPDRLRRWSRGQPSRWSLFLLPFLVLLDSLEGQTAVSTAEDIYTLY
jgi:hypothetical protein